MSSVYTYIAQAYRILGTNTAAIAASWASASVRLAWLRDTYVPNLVSHTAYSHVMAAEATVSGYNQGGFHITEKGATTFSESPFSEHLIATPVAGAVPSASDIKYAALYESTGTASTSPLRILYTLDDPLTTPNSTIVWCQWNPRGLWSHYQGLRLSVYEGHLVVGNRGAATT